MSKAADLANLIGNINAGGGGVNRNVLVNGAMNVAQRATSSTGLGADTSSTTSTRYKVCDRWGFEASGTNGRFTMSQDTSVPTGKGFANSLKLDCTTADTSVAAGELLVLQQRIEGQNLQAFAKGTSEAKPFSLSFYAKANASKTYVAELFDIDNSRHCNIAFTVGTDWAKHEITFPADTTGAFDDDNAESIRFNIWLHAGTTFNPTSGGTLATTWQAEDADDRATGIGSFFSSTDNTFFITGVQLEVGQNPTEFEHEPFGDTLQKCQRYYYSLPDTPTSSFRLVHLAHVQTSTFGNSCFNHPTPMRAQPTITENGTLVMHDGGSNRDYAIGANYSTTTSVATNITTSSFANTPQSGSVSNNSNASNFLTIDAEL